MTTEQPSWRVIHADVFDGLRSLEPESVQTVVTSPPYWGLRDYGTDGQLGLEPTPEAYVERMVEVFREVRRVLRSDGTVWLNLGDSYASQPVGSFNGGGFKDRAKRDLSGVETSGRMDKLAASGLKPKDLVGIPWRVAFALQADGWWLRSDIIWAKPNPMPESVTDRPTKAHEYVFLLTRSARYYYDADAVAEKSIHNGVTVRYGPESKNLLAGDGTNDRRTLIAREMVVPPTRNIRSVWSIATEPFPEAHFATFPKALVVPCVKAGSSEKGCCGECGAPWERVVTERPYPKELANAKKAHGGVGNNLGGQRHQEWMADNPRSTTGWRPSCTHGTEPVPCVVLDPFCGSGTTGVVALREGRSFVGIELNADYAEMARWRIADDAPMFNVPAEVL